MRGAQGCLEAMRDPRGPPEAIWGAQKCLEAMKTKTLAQRFTRAATKFHNNKILPHRSKNKFFKGKFEGEYDELGQVKRS